MHHRHVHDNERIGSKAGKTQQKSTLYRLKCGNDSFLFDRVHKMHFFFIAKIKVPARASSLVRPVGKGFNK